ncbi:MAG: hypothetical protein ACYDBB_07345 [Armatimonadota bacterium]
MKKLLILGIAMVVASAAFAYPTASTFAMTAGPVAAGTIGGATGGFMVPNADINTGITVAVDRFEGFQGEWPGTQLLWGAMPNLEVGAGYSKFGFTAWNINAKYALPIDLAGGKLAIGGAYAKDDFMDFNIRAWDAYLTGTWTVMGDLKFTGNVTYAKYSSDILGDENNTDFMVALAKPFENGAELGAELDLNPPFDQGVFGNVYYIFPVNDNLSARVALAGLGQATTWNLSAAYTFGN